MCRFLFKLYLGVIFFVFKNIKNINIVKIKNKGIFFERIVKVFVLYCIGSVV